jgi:serine/threonine protein kinase/tetratricopeptide (TPR) repeat protein
VIALGPQHELVSLAASIADGEAVDWDALEAAAQSDYRRQVLRELRLIAGMAALHRTQAEEDEAAPTPGVAPALGPATPPAASSPGSPEPAVSSSSHRSRSSEDASESGQPSASSEGLAFLSIGAWGPFTLVEKVGEGAFGEVYRARDALQRDVALKLLRQGRGSSAQVSARILHEGRIMARVRHTNVVTVYGSEEHEGRIGLSMEFVRGRTLEALLDTHGRFSAREAALIGRELCRALAATHAAGLVHRDVKARNVMREEGGRVVLMDFGAGQLSEPEAGTVGRGVTGTPLYLAPELLTTGDATIRSDIYSLGVLLFHLVTRSYPVQAMTLDDLRLAHARDARRRLNDLRPELPDDFVRVVERAIDAEPQRRFPSAGAMQDALSGTLATDPWSDHGFVERRRDGAPGASAASGAISDDSMPAAIPATEGSPASRGRRSWGLLVPLVASAFLLGALAAAMTALVWSRRASEAPVTSGAPAVAAATRPLRVAIRAAGINDASANGATANGASANGTGKNSGGVNGSGANSDSMLSANMAEQLEHDLSASPNLRVIAAAAVEALGDRPAAALMQSLDADAVLEVSGSEQDHSARGSIRILRAGAEPILVDTPPMPANPLRPLTQQLAHQAVERLNVAGASWQPSQRTALPLNNPDAVRLFRRGEDLLQRNGRQDVIDAADAFRESTDLEPDFVLAYAKWAEALFLMYRHNALSRAEVFPVAQDAIAQALQRDAQSGEAHAALADLYAEKDHDWDKAETMFRKALALNPSSEYARIRFALLLAGRGRVDEAVTTILEAQRLNPRSSVLRGYSGATLHYARRYEEAARMYESALQFDSQYTAAHIGLCKAYTALKITDRALRSCGEVSRTGAAEPPFVESQLVQIYADAGQPQRAREHLNQLLATYRSRPTGDTAFWLALAHASLSRIDEAFTWLDRAIDARSSRLVYARVDSRLDPLRGDPRFADRLERVENTRQ